jgi:L,D-peptidoglycan transpeptidase YkuD (ErfK/YbiS/YcfS/YnhG family)
MPVARVLSAAVASLGVAGCAVVALRMSSAAPEKNAADPVPAPASTSTAASRPAYLSMHPAAGVRPTSTAAPSPAAVSTSAAGSMSTVTRPTRTAPLAPSTSAAAARSTAPVRAHATSAIARASTTPQPAATTATLKRGVALPLRYSTGTATRVITVTAHTAGSTTATLQAWNKAPGGGWLRLGSAVTAHLGAEGMSTHPSESRSATPIGSFTLTLAFGHLADPGTRLPYIHTNPSDWWISQAGSLYNTHQRCASGCAFTRGSPNEHLDYETPYYNYAVVIDYNTRNAPGGVRAGAGSAFFLHVTDGNPTAGCVAIGQSKLVSLMRWLAPSTHPRILIGLH